MGLSIWHILVVLVVVLIVFGAGRLPHVMGDLGKGIRNFKAGLSGENEADKKKEDKPFLTSGNKDDTKPHA
jgi:sec-independent protein translocase protein TatA